MIRTFQAIIFVFLTLVAGSVYSQKAGASKMTYEEWLQAHDSAAYNDYKRAEVAQEKKDAESVKTKIEAAMADPQIQYLDLGVVPMVEIDSRISSLKNLKRIDIRKAKKLDLHKLFEQLAKLPSLRTLSLTHGNYSSIPSNISALTGLDSLMLSNDNLTALPDDISKLTQLQYLDLGQNTNLNLVVVLTSLSNAPKLSSLALNLCYLSSLPIEISSLRKLKVLNLSENVLSSLPAGINSLTELEELYLGSPHNAFRINEIATFPSGFGALKKLRILNMAGNKLSSLGSDFAQLTSMEDLDLSRNILSEFPDAVTGFTKLKNLNLSRNKISSIPVTVANLISLDSLKVDGDFFSKPDKKIKSLPVEMGKLKNLKTLTLKDNVIEVLPEELGNMKELRNADFRGNLLGALPLSILNLSKLEVLDLKSNEIKDFPDFSKLNSLRDLNIAMNLPADYAVVMPMLTHVKTLRKLDISYNNITREQTKTMKEAMPDCKIVNFDYSNQGRR